MQELMNSYMIKLGNWFHNVVVVVCMVVLFIGVLLCAIVRKRGCGSVREGSRRFRDPPDRAGHAPIGSVQPFLYHNTVEDRGVITF